jgi:DNA-binding transcriptional ArsR family regulator
MLNYPSGLLLDRVYQALADPTRRGIVDRLSRSSATVGELAEPLQMSLPAVLQHLRVLETSGIIRSAKAGRVRTCHLDRAVLRTAEDWVAACRTRWIAELDRLDAYLAEQGDGASPYASPSTETEP